MLLWSLAVILVISATSSSTQIQVHEPQTYQKTYTLQQQHLEYPAQHYISQQKESPEKRAQIVSSQYEQSEHGYQFGFETDNGIKIEESGKDDHGSIAHGTYSYVGDDGQEYKVTYTADENGFQAQGDHLPTPPPIPHEILESLEKNAAEEASGIINDGSYENKEESYHHHKNQGQDNHGHQNIKFEYAPQPQQTKQPKPQYGPPSFHYGPPRELAVEIRPTYQQADVTHSYVSQQQNIPSQEHYVQQYNRPAVQSNPLQQTGPVIYAKRKNFRNKPTQEYKQKQQQYYQIDALAQQKEQEKLADFSEQVYPQLKEYLLKQAAETEQIQPEQIQPSNDDEHVEYAVESQHPSAEATQDAAVNAAPEAKDMITNNEPIIASERDSAHQPSEHRIKHLRKRLTNKNRQ